MRISGACKDGIAYGAEEFSKEFKSRVDSGVWPPKNILCDKYQG